MTNDLIERTCQDILDKQNIKPGDRIDIKSICKSLGIDVKSETLEHGISGLFIMKENKPFIRYNRGESVKRRRFTIAHELGHFILHKETPLFVDTTGDKILFRDSSSTTGEVKKEREANSFAASILMPRKFIEKAIEKASGNLPEPITYLANQFNVSEQAMTYRLANLGYDIGYF